MLARIVAYVRVGEAAQLCPKSPDRAPTPPITYREPHRFLHDPRTLNQLALSLTVVGLACVGVLILAWLRMIVSPAPQEMREGAVLMTTRAFLNGQNPYAFDALPGPANLYGPFYPLLVAGVATVLGPTLLTHRLVNAVGIVVACGLLYRILRREGVSPLTALSGAGLNLAGLLYWVGATARPDGVGMALAMSAYAVMARAPTESRCLAWGVLLSMIGFATKVYYVVPALVAVVWTVGRGDFVRARWLATAVCGALAATTVGLAGVFPAWGPVVLGANLRAAGYDVSHLLRQAGDWAIFSLPLLVALVSSRLWLRSARLVEDSAETGVTRRGLDLWTVSLGVGVASVVLALGGHRGAHMTYLFHLVTPPLTVVALRHVDRLAPRRLAFAASLPIAALLNAHWFAIDPARFARAEETFARLGTAIALARSPAGTSEFAPLILEAGNDPIETGHTEYFRALRSAPLVGRLLGSPEPLRTEAQRFTKTFYTAVDRASFDLVVANQRRLDLFTPELLWHRYRLSERLEIDMAWAQQSWPVDVWVPRR